MFAVKTKGATMHQTIQPAEAGRQYAEAYEAHYGAKNIPAAFALYNRVIAEHPDSFEAEYCRSQLQNILKAVVPKQKIDEAMQQLMVAQFEHTAASGSACESRQ